MAVNQVIGRSSRGSETFFALKNNLLWIKLISFIGGGDNFYQLNSVYFFLRLKIYKAIAAIFWQSASFVFKICSHIFIIFEVKLE